MAAMKIYDVFDNGQWIGSYNTDAITKLYKVSDKTIASYARKGIMAQKRYTFKFLKELGNETISSTWEKEWDAARYKLLTGRRKIHGES